MSNSASQDNRGPVDGTGKPNNIPRIELPKGGGAIRGLGEKFTANPVTGTGAMTIPITVTPGRSGFSPQLSLSYDSGSGNGPFGFGWQITLPAIRRKTDKGLPRYQDTEPSDRFIFSGAEDLMPVRVEDDGQWRRDPPTHRIVHGTRYRIERYRPRIEGLFARIERWTDITDPESVFWRAISKDNITTWYGRSADSRIFDPADPTHIFTWLICESHDDKGNVIVYQYKSEDSAQLDLSGSHERNRTASSRSANRYLKRIQHGNRSPYFPELREDAPLTPLPEQWLFEVVFDYGEGHYETLPTDPQGREFATASLNEDRDWSMRQDPFSSYRQGFEVRTYRLCRRVLMFHHFPDELGHSDVLVRATAFDYKESPIAALLTTVTQSGYRRLPDNTYLKRSVPPLTFTYSQAEIQEEVREIDAESMENLPAGLDGVQYRWVDLDGEGISGILTEQAGQWFYKPNLSPAALSPETGSETNGVRFGPMAQVSLKPSIAAINSGRQQFLDLAGDGHLDLVDLDGPAPGFYERTPEAGWALFRPFSSLPNLDGSDPNLRFIDLTGDGRSDVLITEDEIFTWYPSLAEAGFGPGRRTRQPVDEEQGPRLVFSDSTQSIYLADLSGDGLTDLARIRNGEVCYWPNLGYGRFGPKITMDNAPRFDAPDQFDPRRLHLADIDGSGVTDLIYVGRDRVHLYFNRSGNSWSDSRPLTAFPRTDNLANVTTADLLGNGTACLIWSSPLPGDTHSPLRYIDLMGGQKPHLLVRAANNMGTETRIRYVPSTHFYLADRAAGRPWITRLPFPVHVVERVETFDHVSRNRFVTRYAYHHGYFDGVEREFRGFGMVEQWDTESFGVLTAGGVFPEGDNIDAASHVPPVLTRTWFHTGAFLDRHRISRHYADEYYMEPGLDDDQLAALQLPDTLLPDAITLPDGTQTPWDLSAEEAREACRALKGSVLRQEIYSPDNTAAAPHPYQISERNYTVALLQPGGSDAHAVFLTQAREAVTFLYERQLYTVAGQPAADPRIRHTMVLESDGFGNVLQSLDIGYGRRHPADDPLLLSEDHGQQSRTHTTFTQNRYTNPVQTDDAHWTPLIAETRTFELINMPLPGPIALLSLEEMKTAAAAAGDGSHDIPFEDVDAIAASGDARFRRLLEHARTYYRRDDLDGLLPLGELQSHALSGQSFQLAFTPGLVNGIYGSRVDDALMQDEGGYVDLDGDGSWWMPSAQTFLSPDPSDTAAQEAAHARAHFFLPRRFHDPFGETSIVTYDAHDLLLIETVDPLGNTTRATQDYRVLQPAQVTDPNGNRSTAAFDALGMVTGTAVMGKVGENSGDSLDGFVSDLSPETAREHLEDPFAAPHTVLGRATTRMIYDLHAFHRTQADPQPQPAVIYTLSREVHDAALEAGASTPIRHEFTYWDGFGRTIQQKIQAEPGPVESGGMDAAPRWTGSGWVIFNNKGAPVKRYEPFFSTTHGFEFAREQGVGTLLFYDPAGRAVATLYPDHVWEKVIFDPWHEETWDVNDTLLIADPANDPDVGAFFSRLPDSEYLPTWHALRISGAMGPDAQTAAVKAAAHAHTPKRVFLDTLGRSCLVIENNGSQSLAARNEYDIEGNILTVTDRRQRRVMAYTLAKALPDGGTRRLSGYDVAGNLIYQHHMDTGERRLLRNVMGQRMRSWDSRGRTVRMVYDALQRPTDRFVQEDGNAPVLVQRTVYGEGQGSAANHRGRIFQQFDGAGEVFNDAFDFKGNLLSSTRRFAVEYRDRLDWQSPVALEDEPFTTRTAYDALNRPSAVFTPDNSILHPKYNEADLLEQVDGNLRGADALTVFVRNMDYNARGQRTRIEYGNGVQTRYEYDPLTFRPVRLLTTRGADILQDLNYTYDPVGNIVSIRDDAQQTVYFNNAVVAPRADYTYDALYRLVEATGREHMGQAAQPQTTWRDEFRTALPHPHDGGAMRRYTEQYTYDAVGNILELVHTAAAGGWTRTYEYTDPSLLEPGRAGNRLSRTIVGGVTELFSHDAHGNMTAMPHLPQMVWDHNDQLHQVDLGGGGTAYYRYDAAGQRTRKVIERQNGTRQSERRYMGLFEVNREYNGAGDTITLAHETLFVMDDVRRLAMVEMRTQGNDGSPEQLIRYQLNNHINSAVLELDGLGQIITYEEYYPYGGTAYQAVRGQVEAPKRYRFGGRERDAETGLNYHGTRYYAPWLGRWTAADPAGMADGTNLFRYTRNNPVVLRDPNGRISWGSIIGIGVAVVVGTLVTVATAGLAAPLVGAVAAGVIGGVVGGAVGGAAGQIAEDLVDRGEVNWGNVGWSALVGGVTGGIFSGAGAALTRTAIGKAITARVVNSSIGQTVARGLYRLSTSRIGNAARATSRAIERNVQRPAEEAGEALANRMGGRFAERAAEHRAGREAVEEAAAAAQVRPGEGQPGRTRAAMRGEVDGDAVDLRTRSGQRGSTTGEGAIQDSAGNHIASAPDPRTIPELPSHPMTLSSGGRPQAGYHGEFKLLGYSLLRTRPDSTGRLALQATNPFCNSCTANIWNLRAARPNINLQTSTSLMSPSGAVGGVSSQLQLSAVYADEWSTPPPVPPSVSGPDISPAGNMLQLQFSF